MHISSASNAENIHTASEFFFEAHFLYFNLDNLPEQGKSRFLNILLREMDAFQQLFGVQKKKRKGF